MYVFIVLYLHILPKVPQTTYLHVLYYEILKHPKMILICINLPTKKIEVPDALDNFSRRNNW